MFKIALLGAGRIGAIHGLNAAANARLELAIIVDPDPHAAGALAQKTDARQGALEAVLADASIAGVIVASPTGDHLEHVRRCAAAGKAVLCEKPIDLDLSRARAAGADLAGARLLVGFNRRFDPHFAALETALKAGDIGALESLHIVSHDPAPPPPAYIARSGGLFKDMTIHDFDMARWLLGEEPHEVFASASCLIEPAIGAAGDVDTARTLMRTPSGRLCTISNSRRSGYGYDQRIEVFGSGGMLRAGNVCQSTVERWDEAGARSAPLENFFLDRYRDAYRRELDHFAEVLAGATPLVGIADAIAALALAEAAGESAKTGKLTRV
ncbi:MAG TPA: inositol 2-dehydrogenase [Caulobacteraceae bacterium]